MQPKDVTHFDTPAAFRKWLTAFHCERDELWVGYWKKATQRPSITWEESVDEALCFGWIDGIRKRIDEESYAIRSTPRRPGSTWSLRNIDRYRALATAGRIEPAGAAVYRLRTDENSETYSMQLRTTDQSAAIACLESIAATEPGAGLQFYVAEPIEEWLAVFPNFTPELEQTAKSLSAKLDCLVLLLLLADEDDLYFMFFRDGKQLPWFKVGAGRKRTGKERDKLATKLEALGEICDAENRARLVSILADATDVTFMSEVLSSVCEIIGVHNAITSFDYLSRGDRDGLETSAEPILVSLPQGPGLARTVHGQVDRT